MDKKDLNDAFDTLTPPDELEQRVAGSIRGRNKKANKAAGSPAPQRREPLAGRAAAGGAVAAVRPAAKKRSVAIFVTVIIVLIALVPVIGLLNYSSSYGNNESGLRAFSSIAQVKNYVGARRNQYYRPSSGSGWFTSQNVSTDDRAEGTSSIDTSHSTTNVQVDGVAESDVVHTDGDYIYMLSYYSLSVVDIRGGAFESMLDLEYDNFAPSSMYLMDDENKLVVLGSFYTPKPYSDYAVNGAADVLSIECPYWGNNSFGFKVYDIDALLSGDSKPQREMDFKNCYLSSSRMIAGKLYIVLTANSYIYNENGTSQVWLPGYYDSASGGVGLEAADIFATPDNGMNYNFTVIAGVDLGKSESADVKAYFGSVGTLYASHNAFYITYSRYRSEKFFGYYNYEYLGLGIMRFEIDGISLKYKGLGKTAGYVINQFAMDEYTYGEGEYEGKTFLRIATTNSSKQESCITVFDSDMQQVGFLEGLGKGEQIYSVRFSGEQAVVVTYYQIDPLYVINLEDPYNPSVKSELKIPGVSDYLHFLKVKDGYVFAVGRSQAENGTWLNGIKVSLFDISGDETVEVAYYAVDGDSYSEATYNHKAIMYFMPQDSGKEIFALPVNTYDYYNGQYINGYNLYYYEINASGEMTQTVLGYHAGEKNEAEMIKSNSYGYTTYYRDSLRRSVIAGGNIYLIGYSGIERFSLSELPVTCNDPGDMLTIDVKYWEKY